MERVLHLFQKRDMELVRSQKKWKLFLKNNGYTLHRCIGSGSFGDVYAVTKKTTGVRLAMKRLVARKKITEDSYAMAEIEALMELDHPNIVVLEELILCNRLACIVLELAPCGNLEMLMAHSRDKVNDIFIRTAYRHILAAVEYCHNCELAHRDVNPSNILIFGDSLVKLADFGLCVRCRDSVTGAAVLCNDYLGQDAYLAPEVKLHEPFPAKPADIWALGCLLFFKINGVSPPVNDLEFLAIINRMQGELTMANDSKNQLYLSVIARMCQVDAHQRPSVSEAILIWDT